MGARRFLVIGAVVAVASLGGAQLTQSASSASQEPTGTAATSVGREPARAAGRPSAQKPKSPLPVRPGAVVPAGSVRAALRHVRSAGLERPIRILVTNDDGVGAPGIDALVEGLRRIPRAEITVVAPATNQSGTGDSYSEEALVVRDATTASGYPAKAVEGRPADTVYWAVKTAYATPDIVVSGINFGQNFGDAVNLSGTVGAATTAARLGIPAVAVSEGIPATSYAQAADIATVFVAWVGTDLVRNPPAPGYQTVTNINVPDCGRINGVVAVPIGRLRTHAGFTANGDGSFTPQFADREFGAFDCASGATTATDDIDAYNKGLVGITQVRPLSSGL